MYIAQIILWGVIILNKSELNFPRGRAVPRQPKLHFQRSKLLFKPTHKKGETKTRYFSTIRVCQSNKLATITCIITIRITGLYNRERRKDTSRGRARRRGEALLSLRFVSPSRTGVAGCPLLIPTLTLQVNSVKLFFDIAHAIPQFS